MSNYWRTAGQAKDLLDLPEELPTRPAGYYGVNMIGGKISGFEHNHQFSSPRKRATMVTKMLRTSPVLSLAEDLITSRVTAVRLTVPRHPGVSEDAAQALEMWLGLGPYEDSGGRMGDGMTPDNLIRHLMSAKFYGHVLLSESWSYNRDEKLYFCHLHRRHQMSMDTYITEREGSGRLLAVTQRYGQMGNAINGRVLPMGESLWFVNGVSNWHDGESVLRPVYPHWRSATLRYRLEDQLANKYADPPTVCSLDMEQFYKFANSDDGSPPSREDLTAEIAGLAEKLTGLHSEESGHLILPSFWSVEERARHNYDPTALLASASHHERVCAEKLFVSTLLQGREGGGSYSMVKTQAELAITGVIDTVQSMLSALNRQTVRRFLAVNFGNLKTSEYPYVSFDRSSAGKIPWWQENSDAFASFVTSGILNATPEDERAIRAASDLPPIPDDENPTTLDRQANASGGRLKTAQGQREAQRPGASPRRQNRFVNRLVQRGSGDGDD